MFTTVTAQLSTPTLLRLTEHLQAHSESKDVTQALNMALEFWLDAKNELPPSADPAGSRGAYRQKKETGRIPSLFFLRRPGPKVRGGTSCAGWWLDYLAGVAGVAGAAGVAGVAGSAAAGLAAFSALAFSVLAFL